MTPEPKGLGWSTGGYHIIVESNGQPRVIYNYNKITNGVLSYGGVWNGNSIHISYTGGRKEGEITKQQVHTLRRAIAHILEIYPSIKILGHNQISEKHCPNFNVVEFCRNIGISEKNIYTRENFKNFSGSFTKHNDLVEMLESGEEYAEDVDLGFNLLSY